jgi:hypothetical protein
MVATVVLLAAVGAASVPLFRALALPLILPASRPPDTRRPLLGVP